MHRERNIEDEREGKKGKRIKGKCTYDNTRSRIKQKRTYGHESSENIFGGTEKGEVKENIGMRVDQKGRYIVVNRGL